jgi:DNA-binding transcriptional ArsR family regulator
MAPDLLSTICREIDERLNELRPLLGEYEQLLVATGAIEATNGEIVSGATPIKPAKAAPDDTVIDGKADGGSARRPKAVKARGGTTWSPAGKPKLVLGARAARGAAREAILAALEHGSHTVGELVVVTAMSGPNINGNLRRLVSEGAVVKTEREGKRAWSLPGGAV